MDDMATASARYQSQRHHVSLQRTQQSTPEASRRPPNNRARKACMRCYKQKLKCDNERPCALCTRSNMECMENSTRQRRKLNHKDAATGNSSATTEATDQGLLRQPLKDLNTPPHDAGSRFESQPPSPISECHTRPEPLTRVSSNSCSLNFHIFTTWNSPPSEHSRAESTSHTLLTSANRSHGQGRVLIVDSIGMELPPFEVAQLLLNCYIDTTHWFQLLVHEPTFRVEFDEMLRLGSIQPHRQAFVLVSLVILAVGCTWASNEKVQQLRLRIDLLELQKQMIGKVEAKLFDMLEAGSIESVQAGTMLATYFAFHADRPRRGDIVLGATIKSALALGLHDESVWGDMEQIARELRRRAWQSLCISEIYFAIHSGRPMFINAKVLRNVGDLSMRSPGFDSARPLEEKSSDAVTSLSYHRHKCRLYRILFSILDICYHQNDTPVQDIIRQAKIIRQSLSSWQEILPPELKLSSFKPGSPDSSEDDTLKVLKIQALSFQILYYNAQIILSRPFLTSNPTSQQYSKRNALSVPSSAIPTAIEGASIQELDPEFYQSCRTQCWEAAIGTAKVCEYHDVLRWAGRTPAAPFIGTHCFTAGTILCLFALSCPLTTTSQEAKRAMGRILRIPQIMGSPSLLPRRTITVMEDLLRLVLSEEMNALTSSLLTDSDHISLDQQSLKVVPHASYSLDVLGDSEAVRVPNASGENISNAYENTTPPSTSAIQDGTNINHLISETEIISGSENLHTINLEGLDEAVMAFQNAFRDGKTNPNSQFQQIGQDFASNQDDRQGCTGASGSMAQSVSPESASYSSMKLSMDDFPQMWIWDNEFGHQ